MDKRSYYNIVEKELVETEVVRRIGKYAIVKCKCWKVKIHPKKVIKYYEIVNTENLNVVHDTVKTLKEAIRYTKELQKIEMYSVEKL